MEIKSQKIITYKEKDDPRTLITANIRDFTFYFVTNGIKFSMCDGKEFFWVGNYDISEENVKRMHRIINDFMISNEPMLDLDKAYLTLKADQEANPDAYMKV